MPSKAIECVHVTCTLACDKPFRISSVSVKGDVAFQHTLSHICNWKSHWPFSLQAVIFFSFSHSRTISYTYIYHFILMKTLTLTSS